MSKLEYALHYVAQNIPVFPCGPNKRPLIAGGHNSAVADEATVRKWWAEWPNALIGMPTGKASGRVVVDLDVVKERDAEKLGLAPGFALGERSITDAGLWGELDFAPRVRTQSGGLHYYFADDGDTKNTTNALRGFLDLKNTGVDVRGEGGYVCIADGDQYVQEQSGKSPPLPADLKTKLFKRRELKPTEPSAAPGPALNFDKPSTEPSPALALNFDKPSTEPRAAWIADTGKNLPGAFNDEIKAAELVDLLSYVPPPDDYNDWLALVMAIHDATAGSAQGMALADEWSARGSKYQAGETAAKWGSFEPGRGVGKATIAAAAAQYGADLSAISRKHAPQVLSVSTTQALNHAVETTKATGSLFQSWAEIAETDVPKRDFLYGKHYIRKFASVTVAPGGLGKSTLVLAECIAMATGRAILDIEPGEKKCVVYYNAEDPLEEVQRRVLALCRHHEIQQSELVGQLYIASGRELELILAEGDNGDIVEGTFKLLEGFCAEFSPDLIAFDPLANMTYSPETNDVFRRLGKRLSQFADLYNLAVEIVHHTRKLNGGEATIEDARGGGALIGAVRSGRVLALMSKEEAEKAFLETHIDHFKIEAAGKSNLARQADKATWYERSGIPLDNGDWVASVAPWEWPSAWDGIDKDDADKVRKAIAARGEEYPRFSDQSPDWVGLIVCCELGLDPQKGADKAKAKKLVEGWIETDVLRKTTVKDDMRRPRPAVRVGENNPKSVVST